MQAHKIQHKQDNKWRAATLEIMTIFALESTEMAVYLHK